MIRLRSLDRKLLRDLWRLRSQIMGVCLIVACAVASYVTARIGYESLRASQEEFYRAFRFADVFAHSQRAPRTLEKSLREIPGVDRVETRIVMDVTLDIPGLEEPATGRLVSIPEGRQPALDALYLRSGRFPRPEQTREILVGESFAAANGLRPGDRLGAVLNGKWESLEITGIALSPEYVYEIRGTGSPLPDNRRFGVLWMNQASLADIFDMEGAFNDVVLSLGRGAKEDRVIAGVDQRLARYGGLGAYARKHQLSHALLSNELEELTAWGSMVPAIFLGVTAFLLHLLLSRVVGMQRQQVAILKAFGYRNLEIGAHYAKLVLAMIVGGAIVGVVAGIWLGAGMTALYSQYFRFPILRVTSVGPACLQAVLVSAAAAMLGAAHSIRQIVRLPPAEAMRPEAPARFRAGWLDRLGFARRLAVPNRITLRNLVRRPLRTALAITGVALAVMILVVGRFFLDSVDALVDIAFREASREQVAVDFRDPRAGGVRHELEHLPGVERVEGYRSVPVRLRFGHRSRRSGILGLERGAQLRRIIDQRSRSVALPEEGLALSAHLADNLRVQVGDTLDVDLLEGDRRTRRVVVAARVEEPMGESVYMELPALHRLLGEGGTLSGAYLRVDPLQLASLYRTLKRTPAVGAVTIRTATLASFEATAGRTFGIFTAVLVLFATMMAMAMVYNGARVAFSERSRELGSLRILGFRGDEAVTMLLSEQWITTLVALPLGLALGFGMCSLISKVHASDLFRLPVTISAASCAFALGVVLAAAAASALLIRRRVLGMELIEALKTNE